MKQPFLPREKLGKKAQRALDREKRVTWDGVNPVTKRIESKKLYQRTKPSRLYTDDGMGVFFSSAAAAPAAPCPALQFPHARDIIVYPPLQRMPGRDAGAWNWQTSTKEARNGTV